MDHDFSVLSNKSLHNLKTERFSSVCPVCFLILPLTFRSMIHFMLIVNKFLKTICIVPQLRAPCY